MNENHAAFNGGEGGIQARPTAEEERYSHEQHMAPLASQTEHEHMAMQNRDNFANVNHGRPAIAATARAGDFSGRSAIPARSAGGEYHAPAMSPHEARGSVANNSSEGGRSNEGFRSFTPPAKNNGGNMHNENQNRATESHPQSHPNNSQQHKSSPPPAKHSGPPPNEEKRK